MKKQSFRSRFETSVSADAESRSISVVASTPAMDSAGRVVIQDWDLSRFEKNPTVLWNHGMGGGIFGAGSDDMTLPIGFAKDVRVEDGKLLATLHFVDEKANPIAEKVFQGFKQGSLRAVSVGWRTTEVEEIDLGDGSSALRLSGNELLEISAVAIPANAEAVKQGAALFASLHAAANPHREKEVTQMDESTKLFAALGVSTADEAIGLIAGYKAQSEKVASLTAELEAERAEKKMIKRAALIEEARELGKFTPANEAKYLAIAGDSLDTLRTLVDALPVVVNREPASTPAAVGAPKLSKREVARIQRLGISEADYLAHKSTPEEV